MNTSQENSFSRVSSAIDVETLHNKHIAVVGLGAILPAVENYARAGVRKFSLFDLDVVEKANFCRQPYHSTSVGQSKAKVAAEILQWLDPHINVTYHHGDFTLLNDKFLDTNFPGVDLWIAATDSFACQQRVNDVALRQGVAAQFLGIYRDANAGEVIWTHPSAPCCLECLVPKRFKAQNAAPGTLDPPSDGVTPSDVAIVDGIGTQIGLAQLTRGANNRFGRLLDQLDHRQFIQVGLRPDWRFGDKDLMRELLEVPKDNDLLFAWNTVARRDPDPQPCPSCERLRGHRFRREGNAWKRIWPADTQSAVNLESNGIVENPM